MRRRIAACGMAILLVALSMLAAATPAGAAGTPIVGPTAATQQQARGWAHQNGAPQTFQDLVPIYWAVAGARGVRADLAYAQSAKETNFGRFTGVVPASHHNPCGLKVTEGGPNNDPAAHAAFPDWTTGVPACVDHLALYAGAATYPRANSPDPRHFPFLWGTAPNAEDLGGRWAPSATYGTSIVQDYLWPMLRTPPDCRHPFVDVPGWVGPAVDWAFCEGHMSGYPGSVFKPDNKLTRAESVRLLYRIAGRPDVSDPAYDHPYTDTAPWVDDAIRRITHDPDQDGPVQPIATGYTGNLFEPNGRITRAQATRMVCRSVGTAAC